MVNARVAYSLRGRVAAEDLDWFCNICGSAGARRQKYMLERGRGGVASCHEREGGRVQAGGDNESILASDT